MIALDVFVLVALPGRVRQRDQSDGALRPCSEPTIRLDDDLWLVTTHKLWTLFYNQVSILRPLLNDYLQVARRIAELRL